MREMRWWRGTLLSPSAAQHGSSWATARRQVSEKALPCITGTSTRLPLLDIGKQRAICQAARVGNRLAPTAILACKTTNLKASTCSHTALVGSEGHL